MPGEALPEGRTCKDCIHWLMCSWLLGVYAKAENTRCDWDPSRFQLKLALQQEVPHAV
jgi:hypothetical protein